MIYLDHNATTPVSPEISESIRPHYCEKWGNPSSSYRFGSNIKHAVITAMTPGPAARQSIQFSLGLENTDAEIREAIAALQRCVATLGGIK